MKFLIFIITFLSLFFFDCESSKLLFTSDLTNENMVIDETLQSDSTLVPAYKVKSFLNLSYYNRIQIPTNEDDFLSFTSDNDLDKIMITHEISFDSSTTNLLTIELPATWKIDTIGLEYGPFIWKSDGTEAYLSELTQYYSTTDSLYNLDEKLDYKENRTAEELIKNEISDIMSIGHFNLVSIEQLPNAYDYNNTGWSRLIKRDHNSKTTLLSTIWENEDCEQCFLLFRKMDWEDRNNSMWSYAYTIMESPNTNFESSKKELTDALMKIILHDEYSHDRNYYDYDLNSIDEDWIAY